MKRNKRLLLKTAKRIEEIPESYDQSTWVEHSDKSPCGTVACLAGELIICSERKVTAGIEKLWAIELSPKLVSTAAAESAGLDHEERMRLFLDARWPKPFSTRYSRARSQRGRANAAAALLRYIAEGGEL